MQNLSTVLPSAIFAIVKEVIKHSLDVKTIFVVYAVQNSKSKINFWYWARNEPNSLQKLFFEF